MTITRNPYTDAISDARNLLAVLDENAMTLRFALEQRQYGVQAHQTAKQTYADAEAEFLADLAADAGYQACKNAEAREVFRDAALVKARQGGVLAHPWAVMNDCKLSLDNAQLAFDQAELAFKASRAAAELMAQMLRAASV